MISGIGKGVIGMCPNEENGVEDRAKVWKLEGLGLIVMDE